MYSRFCFTKGKLVWQDLAGQMGPYNTFFNYGFSLVPVFVAIGREKRPPFQTNSHLFFCLWHSHGAHSRAFYTK
jgi:hypothetical protein